MDEESIKRENKAYINNQFKTNQASRVQISGPFLLPMEKDIQQAMEHCGKNKAPAWDGLKDIFLCEIYQRK